MASTHSKVKLIMIIYAFIYTDIGLVRGIQNTKYCHIENVNDTRRKQRQLGFSFNQIRNKICPDQQRRIWHRRVIHSKYLTCATFIEISQTHKFNTPNSTLIAAHLLNEFSKQSTK